MDVTELVDKVHQMAAPEIHKRRIAVLTSGGDAPGMNGAVRAVVRTAIAKNCEAYFVYEGYEGLVAGGDKIKEARWDDVRGFLPLGGTEIGSARCESFKGRPGRLAAAKNMVDRGIDALVVCGGDGSLTGANVFREEWPGLLHELVESGKLRQDQTERYSQLNIVGLVGSIDNDMSSTDATIGCYSSLHRICECIDSINDTAHSHQRAFVVEVMGRNCGWLALMAAISTGADFLFIPESPPGEDWQDQMRGVIRTHRELGKRVTIIIVAEGAIDQKLQKITPNQVKVFLTEQLKLDTRVTTLGHIQRGGSPCYYDRMLSTLQGCEAVNAVLEATPETQSSVIAMIENKIVRNSLVEAVKLTSQVLVAIKAKNFARAMKLRDAEFGEYYEAYRITTTSDRPGRLLHQSKRLRVGIIHVGAPCGGMNSATRAAVAYCLTQGHTPLALYNGFSGLIRHHSDKPLGAVRGITWLEADNWVSRGGSEIGTNRTLPSESIPEVALAFSKYNIQALLIIGGFEAFAAVSELEKARQSYGEFQIPMLCIPATISNNVPGTEYSLGSDTCLNSLMKYCDTLRQSASSSRRRVFVVETQGGESGYVATCTGLAVGAFSVYTPEKGISIKMIDRDIDRLRTLFALDHGQPRAGKIILVNEKASKVYKAGLIADMIQEEAKGRFEAKSGVPGHFQQGREPSPMDRIRAVRFAVKSMQHLERYAEMTKEEIVSDPLSCSLIGIRGAEVTIGSVKQIGAEETNWKNRRPLNEYWSEMAELNDMLVNNAT